MDCGTHGARALAVGGCEGPRPRHHPAAALTLAAAPIGAARAVDATIAALAAAVPARRGAAVAAAEPARATPRATAGVQRCANDPPLPNVDIGHLQRKQLQKCQ